MNRRMPVTAALSLMVLFLPGLASAHTGTGAANGFVHGMAHPLGGFDHLIAMITVGVLAALIGGRARLTVPAGFVGFMLLGAVFGASGIEIPLGEVGIGLSLLVLGGAVMFGRRMNAVAGVALAGFFAIFHGYAHGLEMTATDSGLAYGAGFALVTAALHGVGLGGVVLLGREMRIRTEQAVRLFGGAVSFAGVGLLAVSF